MYYPHNEPASEVKRDQLLQTSLAYWSAAPRAVAEPDPLAWEAGVPVGTKAGPWVMLLLAIIIMLALSVIFL